VGRPKGRKTGEQMTVAAIYIPLDLAERIKTRAANLEMSVSELVRWKLTREFPPALEEPFETTDDWRRSNGE